MLRGFQVRAITINRVIAYMNSGEYELNHWALVAVAESHSVQLHLKIILSLTTEVTQMIELQILTFNCLLFLWNYLTHIYAFPWSKYCRLCSLFINYTCFIPDYLFHLFIFPLLRQIKMFFSCIDPVDLSFNYSWFICCTLFDENVTDYFSKILFKEETVNQCIYSKYYSLKLPSYKQELDCNT